MAATRGRDIVVVAASAGGIEALRGLLSQVPESVPAALLVVLHVPAAGGKVLPRILARAGRLPASAASDGETPLPGHVYVAPPDRHILLVGDKIRLSQGPRHNGHRPAADPLFISAALSGGPHTTAVVLSGTLDDGAAGAAAVERRGDQFEPVDLRKRLFRRIGKSIPAEPPRSAQPANNRGRADAGGTGLESAALAAGPVAQLVIDRGGRLVAANARAETLFSLRPRDVGRPFQDLEVSYRPVELRSIIEQVISEQRSAELTDVLWHRGLGVEPSVFDVNVVPLYRHSDVPVGVGISFLDVTKYRQLREELERSNHDLEHAYEELQSPNEELETTNEELQSTNEELETMNEELQSTNDELQMINDVLRLRGEELDSTKAFAASTLRSLGRAVVVVDNDLRVFVWGPGAEDLWGLRSEEATGRGFADLDIGLPVADIVPVLKQTLTGQPARTEAEVQAITRRGRPVSMLLEYLLLSDEEGASRGVIIVMNEVAGSQ